MRIDHLVFNVDKDFENNQEMIKQLQNAGLPYNPKGGKQTKGFKISNLFIGKEYFEFVDIKKVEINDWRSDWVNLREKGYFGCTCIMIGIDDLEKIIDKMIDFGIQNPSRERITFKLFKFFKITNPWVNTYLPFFENENIQIGFQELDDPNYMDKMKKRMKPNSDEFGIDRISKVMVNGKWSKNDIEMLSYIFLDNVISKTSECLEIKLDEQYLIFNVAPILCIDISLEGTKQLLEFVEVSNVKFLANK